MFAFRRILYRISPEIHTLEFIPVLLYLLMSHSFLCLCYHVNQEFGLGSGPHGTGGGVETLPGDAVCPYMAVCCCRGSWNILVSGWELPGKAHPSRWSCITQSHPFLLATHSLCAFVPEGHFCYDLTLGHPFDNLSIRRSCHRVDTESRLLGGVAAEESVGGPRVHVAVSELGPSLILHNPPQSCSRTVQYNQFLCGCRLNQGKLSQPRHY